MENYPRIRFFSLILSLFFLSLVFVIPAAAQTETPEAPPEAQNSTGALTLRAEPAFAGNFKFGEWLPVWVEVENSGPDVEAEARVSIQTNSGTLVYAAPVSLPNGARKRLPLYVLPNNFSRELSVELVEAGDPGTVLASQKIQVQPHSNVTFLAGLISPQQSALALIQGIEIPGQRRPVELVEMSLAELPEKAEGLRSFDVLVINDVDTGAITPAQTAALEGWVRNGGRLVVGGGAGAQATAAGLSGTLLPFRPTGDRQVDELPALETFSDAEPIRVPGPFLVATGDPDDSLPSGVLAGDEDLPLVVERELGKGAVDWVALDLTQAPFDAWSGATGFWQALLTPGAAYPDWRPADVSPRQERASSMPYALTNLPSLDLPSARSLAFLLGFYVLLVGPANYLVLKRANRLHLAWITIPAITGLFTAGAFGLGYALRGNDLILNKIAIVEPAADGSAHLTSYMGLFSPGRQSYELAVGENAAEGQGLLSPLGAYYDPWGGPPPANLQTGEAMVFVQDRPSMVRGLSVDQWSMQSFMSESDWSDFGRIEADLRLEGESLTGTLTNESEFTLNDAVLVMGRNFVRLDDLEPGEQVEVELTFSLPTTPEQRFGQPISYRLFEDEFNNISGGPPPRETELKRMVVESVLERGAYSPLSSFRPVGGELSVARTPIFLAWLDQAPPQVTVSGRQIAEQTTALVTQPVDYRIDQGDELTIPVGLVTGQLVEYSRESGPCGDPNSSSVYLGNGEAVFEFQAPGLSNELAVDRLDLSLLSDGGWWSAPDIALYDWEAGDWAEMSEVVNGINKIPDAGSYVNPEGLIQLRLSSQGGSQGCYFLDMGLHAAPTGGAQ